MNLARFVIKYPVSLTMQVLAVVVLGFFAWGSLGVDLMPDVEFPFIVIQTVYPGAGASEIETDVTDTIEEAVSWGNSFIRGFMAALHRQDEHGISINADTDENGYVSMVEAFNYAAAEDIADEIPQYDDNGDGISHTDPVPTGGDGGPAAAELQAVQGDGDARLELPLDRDERGYGEF